MVVYKLNHTKLFAFINYSHLKKKNKKKEQKKKLKTKNIKYVT